MAAAHNRGMPDIDPSLSVAVNLTGRQRAAAQHVAEATFVSPLANLLFVGVFFGFIAGAVVQFMLLYRLLSWWNAGADFAAPMFWLGVGGVGLSVLGLALFAGMNRRRLRFEDRSSRYRIDDQALVITRGGSELRYAWADVLDVRKDARKRQLFVQLRWNTIETLPVSAFASADAAELFFTRLRERMLAARTP